MSNIAPKRDHTDFIQSASVTALMRALLAETKDCLENPDFLAKHFVSAPWSDFLKNSQQARNNLQERVPGCMYYHLVRTKQFDESLLNWIKNKQDGQIIILGAGFDSRHLRFKELLTNHQVYEFDLQTMIEYKKKVIKNTFDINQQPVTQYIAINFHEESLIDSFHPVGILRNKATLILWEGVTYFLEEKTTTEILSSLSKFFEAELQIVFDYAYADYINGNLSYYGAKELARELQAIGEPHLFGVDPVEIEDFAKKLNYTVRNNYPAKALEKKYLQADGGLLAHIHGFHGIVELAKA
jgi:methyltransferase (TIGR00027 family)